VLEPVGPLSPKTYWIRRIALVVVAVVVLLLVVWIVSGRGSEPSPPTSAPTSTTSSVPLTGELAASTGGTPSAGPTVPETSNSSVPSATDPAAPSGASPGAQAPVGSDAAATTTAQATEIPATADPGAVPGSDPGAAQSAAAEAAAAQSAAEAASAASAASEAARPRDAEGRLICPDSAIQLSATVGSPTYNVGEQPVVGVTVVNAGTEACVRDVSGSLQEYLAYDTAGSRLWSTSDCLPGEGTDVRFLQPGQSLQYNIRWSGTTSQPGCAAERTRVPAGEYRIEARIGGLVSSPATLTFH
jgi:hypothetical protein